MSSEHPITDLLLRWEKLRNQGETISGEDLCRDCPEHLPEVRRRMEELEAVDRALDLFGSLSGLKKQTAPVALEPALPSSRGFPTIPGYDVLEVLGRGAMGVVYKARHLGLKRLVALKMILAGGHAGETELQRFRAEAEMVARLQHPHIVQIFEVGEVEGRPFFALEFIEGGSLAQKLAAGPLPAREAAQLVEMLAQGVRAAHQRGIVHRDLKPANVLLTAEGLPKIADFGLAKRLDAEGGQTQSGAVLGTPSYMAPEQAAGKTRKVGPATDVYALGALLYDVVTGRPPFKAATAWDTLGQVLNTEPVPPSRLQPQVSRDLETICLKCLAKEPARRYADAGLLAEDLRRFLEGKPIRARRVGLGERALKYARRKPGVVAAWAAGVAAVLFLLAGGGYYLYRQNLDLEAELARQQNLEDSRVRAAARVSTAETALRKRDWPGAVAAANEVLALVGDEPALVPLQARALRLHAGAEKVIRFTACRDQTLYHAVLALEEVNQRTHRQAAQAAAQGGLALFELTGEGPAGLPRFGNDLLGPDTERWLTESCYELYLTWAQVLFFPPAAAPEERRAQGNQALRLLDRAAHLGLTSRSYHQRRAEILASLGEKVGAQTEQGRAAALTPSQPLDHFLLGMELNRAGELEGAAAHLKKVLEQQPDHFWASYYLAGCYLRRRPQRFERALTPLTVCIQMKPAFVWPYLLRGFVYGQLGDYEAAAADFEAAAKQPLDEPARYGLWVNRAVVRMGEGMNQEARGRKWRESGQPAEAERAARRAGACYEAAVSDLQQAVALRPQQPQAHANLAEVQLRRGQPTEAVPALDRALALAPTPALYRTRARLHEKQGNYAAALPDLEQAIRLAQAASKPREAAGDQLQRGRILFRLGKFRTALQAFDRVLAAAPEMVAAHQLRGETLLELDRVREAVAALDRYLDKGMPSVVAFRARGLGRAKLGNYAGAVEDYSRALAIDRADGKAADPETLAYRGWTYLILEAPKLALRDFDEALRREGTHRSDCHAGRGYARVLLNQWEAAVADADAAIQQGSPLPRTFYNTARIYAQAAARVQIDPKQPAWLRQELSRKYQRQVLERLRSACGRMTAAQRAAFWKEYVDADPVLRPLAGTAAFAQLRQEAGGAN